MIFQMILWNRIHSFIHLPNYWLNTFQIIYRHILIMGILLIMASNTIVGAENSTGTDVNNSNNNNNNLSTGALIGLVIGLIIICTIIIVIIYWCIRLRHFYLSQRHTKMYDADMIQPSQNNINHSSGIHFPSVLQPPPPQQQQQSNLYQSRSLSKSMLMGQAIDPSNGQRRSYYPNLNQGGYFNTCIIEDPLKQSAATDSKVNGVVNLSSVDRKSVSKFSQCLQSPSWTDHHYYNTHHFNSGSNNDGFAYNFHQRKSTINEPYITAFHIDPLESVGCQPSSSFATASSSDIVSRSRIRSIAFLSQLSAFGLKNKRRLSHLTQKSTKFKEKVLHNSTANNSVGNSSVFNDDQSNPLPIKETYSNGYEGYHNTNILSDNLDVDTMESLDNDYFLYSLQAAIFNGLIPSSPTNNKVYPPVNEYHKFSFPYTTNTIHEEMDPSFGEDLGLGNTRLSSSLSAYSSSNRNSKAFSPDYTTVSNPSSSNSNNRFKFPPPGPPVAGWVNQFALREETLKNSVSTISNPNTVLPPLSEQNERKASQKKQKKQQQNTPSSLFNTSLDNSPITMLKTTDLSSTTNNKNSNDSIIAAAASSLATVSRSISSVPPSPQHIPFQFVHSSRSLGLASSNIIPRRHAIMKYPIQEIPIVSNLRRSVQINPPSQLSSTLTKLDILVAPHNSPVILANTKLTSDCGLLLFDSSNSGAKNNDNVNQGQQLQSPLSYSDAQQSDSGYHDSIVIREHSLLSSLSVDHSLDFQSSPILLTSSDNELTKDLFSTVTAIPTAINDTTHSTTTNSIPITTHSSVDNTLNDHSIVGDSSNLNKIMEYAYAKLEIPLPISQPIPVSSSASLSSSISSPSTGASSDNSTSVMLRDNSGVDRKFSNPCMSTALSINSAHFNTNNHSQLSFRSPSDPDLFLTFCEDSIRKSTMNQPLPQYIDHRHHPAVSGVVNSSRTNFASNGMMKLMMMSTLSDSFKYHLTRQKSESQLLTDRHDSFDEVLWDFQPTPLY
ncbi:unnamed protein product [Heterobilharzia americana]|nr:unnamed protein product [Heterobilharzia americana]